MTEYIILSRYDLTALCGDIPVEIRIDGKPFTLCSDEYFEKQTAEDKEVDNAELQSNS